MENLDEWWSRGQHVHVRREAGGLAEPERCQIFCRVLGEGPWATLLHGFPSSSWDWAKVAPRLAEKRRLLAFDFLGFGDSSKPRGHAYSLFEQADITQELWRRHGVTETALVAHDYGSSVAVELLARQAEGRLDVCVTHAVVLNAGLYVDLYRPRVIQRLLELPVVGALVARAVGQRRFRKSFAAVFAPRHRPSEAELAQHWEAVARRRGHHQAHRIIRYLGERRRHRERFEGALETSRVPLGFIWGMRDPVSGAPVAERLRARRPQAPFVALDDVGHYPQLEAPDRVAAEALGLLAGQGGRPTDARPLAG